MPERNDIGFGSDPGDTPEGPGRPPEDDEEQDEQSQPPQDDGQDEQPDTGGGGADAGGSGGADAPDTTEPGGTPAPGGGSGQSPPGERDFDGGMDDSGSSEMDPSPGSTPQQADEQTQQQTEEPSPTSGREQASDLDDMGRRQGGPEFAAVSAGTQTVREELRERALERAEREARNDLARTAEGERGAPGDEAAGTAATRPGGERARDTLEETRREAVRSQAAEQIEEQLAAEGRDVDLDEDDVRIVETDDGQQRAELTESARERLSGSGERFGGEGVVESALRDINEAVVDLAGDATETLVSDPNASQAEQARDRALVGAAEGIAQLNPAGLAVTGIEAGEFVVEGGGLVLTGRGGEAADRTVAAGTDIVTGLQDAATTSPQRFAGQLIGSSLGTAGVLRGATRIGGPRTSKATATAIQPGEEAAVTLLRRSGRLAGGATRLGDVRTRLSGTEGRPIETEVADATRAREFVRDTRGQSDGIGLSKADREAATTSEVDSGDGGVDVAEAPRDPSLSGRARGRRRAGDGPTELLRPGTGRAKGVQGFLDEVEAKRQRVEQAEQDAGDADDVTVREAERRRSEAVEPRGRVSETDLEPSVERADIVTRTRAEAAAREAQQEQVGEQTAEVAASDVEPEPGQPTARGRAEDAADADGRVGTDLDGRVSLGERIRGRSETDVDVTTRLDERVDSRLDTRQDTRLESRQETRQESRQKTRIETRLETRQETRREAEVAGRERRRGRDEREQLLRSSLFSREFGADVPTPSAVISGAAFADIDLDIDVGELD